MNEKIKKYLYKYHRIILIGSGVSIALIMLIGFLLFNQRDYKVSSMSDLALNNDVQKEEKEVINNNYYVEIKGAVTNPGVYKMSETARIIDVINEASGLLETADVSPLNLSKKVTDEMLIIIYTKDEIASFKKGNVTITEVVKYIEKECTCPDPVINEACEKNNSSNSPDTPLSSVNINSATKTELMTLTGIGESKADDIIAYRNTNGPFEKLEDLKNVTGIGDAVFDKIKDHITI